MCLHRCRLLGGFSDSRSWAQHVCSRHQVLGWPRPLLDSGGCTQTRDHMGIHGQRQALLAGSHSIPRPLLCTWGTGVTILGTPHVPEPASLPKDASRCLTTGSPCLPTTSRRCACTHGWWPRGQSGPDNCHSISDPKAQGQGTETLRGIAAPSTHWKPLEGAQLAQGP